MTSERKPRSWRDRYGNTHEELSAQAPTNTPSVPRVPGQLELAWNEEDPDRERLLREALFADNPTVSPGSEDAEGRQYTWVVSEPFASSVLLLANGAFDPADVEQSQFARLDGTGAWTLTLQMPDDWRASYRIAVWEGEQEPPWKAAAQDEVARAALDAALPDPRCEEIMSVPAGRFSVVSGPEAQQQIWRSGVVGGGDAPGDGGGAFGGDAAGRDRADDGTGDGEPSLDVEAIAALHVDTLEFPEDDGPARRVWVYRPPSARPGADQSAGVDHLSAGVLPGDPSSDGGHPDDAAQTSDGERTPVLILFDGQVWNEQIGLPELLEAAISSGAIPPLHVAMVEAPNADERHESLGVPGGQVDFVLDSLLDRLRAEYPVARGGEATIVAGQGQGGLSALWALALGEDAISHAIAQSPALWRFDVAQALLANGGWKSATIQAGRYEDSEGRALGLCQSLVEAVTSDPKLGNRSIGVEAVSGGHDWAWWRAGLFQALAAILS
ncbi:MAG: alpha/beta hydrolase-fold protein [Actinomycetaceae bacterium]|nr:alpha/beta hydrolase-fold protein [Actinomycetaceae bacterium]